ncbi:MAG: SGNH/GDSL hydrolase family protein [Sandaracinaceae bacterium]
MLTRLLAAILTVLALAAPVSAQVEEEAEAPGLFIVGDSHVQMLGPMLSRALTDEGYRVVGYESRPGWSTAAYVRRGDLREVLEAAGRPEIVVVSLGGNDFAAGPESYLAQLSWIVDQAEAAGAEQVLWVGPATSDMEVSERAAVTGARHERNAELQADLLPSLGVSWIDSRPHTVEDHGRDGIHFTRVGYRSWTHALVPEGEAKMAAPFVDAAMAPAAARADA